eukprot:m.28537 g.28537  ORF g.28537 m.28537 type:complete len:65 (+) comp13615_c0_seq1:2803-2997(+)
MVPQTAATPEGEGVVAAVADSEGVVVSGDVVVDVAEGVAGAAVEGAVARCDRYNLFESQSIVFV